MLMLSRYGSAPPLPSRSLLSNPLRNPFRATGAVKVSWATRWRNLLPDWGFRAARAVSDDPRTREQGGALPDRFRSDQWSESIVKAVSALRPSEITDPVLYGNAWIVSARVSTGTRAWIATTHSCSAAEASGQATAAPTSVRLPRSTTIVRWPIVASTP